MTAPVTPNVSMSSRAMTPGALRWKNATKKSEAGIDHMPHAAVARIAS
jgi:hypothetical protein